jgi:hypothetical protein
MNTPLKLAGFAVGLVAVFGAAVGAGRLVGPIGSASAEAAVAEHDMSGDDHEEAESDHLPAGLMVSEGGWTLALDDAALPAGSATPLAFRILGPDGRPVTAFDEAHEQELHLIAVRRDLTGFQHVHPVRDDAGVWTVPLALTPGSWRVFADFVPSADGENHILGADLAVPGEHVPEALPTPSRTAEVDDYTVTLDGALRAGTETELVLSVSRDGRPVTDLQPYLGAYGHLVALRAGDLAYLHVHPTGEPGDGATAAGPGIAFRTTAPSTGSYRLFLDFRHGDVVRTASFTVTAS